VRYVAITLLNNCDIQTVMAGDSRTDLSEEALEHVREIAREEAESVYDDLTVEDNTGRTITLSGIQERVGKVAPDLTRRELLKVSVVAFGYVGMGMTVARAVMRALSTPAAADASGQYGTQSDPLTAVITETVSRNVGHEYAYTIWRDASDDVHLVDNSGASVGGSPYTSGAPLLPAIEDAILDMGRGRSIFVADPADGASAGGYNVYDGDAITGIDWPNEVLIEFAPNASIGVQESMTNSVGPDARSVLFDVRRTGTQTALITFIGNGTSVNCQGNVETPFYFADTRQTRWRHFEVDSPSIGPYRFGNEEAATTAQFNYARDYTVYNSGGSDPLHGGMFVGNTDVYPEAARITAQKGVLIDGCPKAYPDDLFLSNMSISQDAVVDCITDSGDITGHASRCRSESTDVDAILRLDATSNSVSDFSGADLWSVLGGNGCAAVELAENGGSVATVGPFDLPRGNVRDTNNTLWLRVTAGDPLGAYVHPAVDHDQSLFGNIDRGPNTSLVIANDYTQEAAGAGNSPTLDVPAGTEVENTDDGTVWYRISGDGYVQLG